MPSRRIETKTTKRAKSARTIKRFEMAELSGRVKAVAAPLELSAAQAKLREAKAPAPLRAEELERAALTLSPEVQARLKAVKSWALGEAVVLSPRTPVIEGKGHIDGWRIVAYHPTAPALYFDYDPRTEFAIGGLNIWLDGLEPAGIYLVEISLSVLGGAIRVGASDAPHAISPAQGLDHKILVTIVEPGQAISLIGLEPIEVTSWAFFDARIARLV